MDSYFVCTDCGKVVPSDSADKHTSSSVLNFYRCSPSWVYGPDDDGREWKNVIEIVVSKGRVRGPL